MAFYVYLKKLDVGGYMPDLVNEEQVKQKMKRESGDAILIIEENGDMYYGNDER